MQSQKFVPVGIHGQRSQKHTDTVVKENPEEEKGKEKKRITWLVESQHSLVEGSRR